MAEEIEVQTVTDVKSIDYMRTNTQIIEEAINEQINQSDMISEALMDIQSNLNGSQGQVDLSEVTDLIENIDTTVVEVQTQDILNIVNEQQTQIDNIKESVDKIDEKLTQILNKL